LQGRHRDVAVNKKAERYKDDSEKKGQMPRGASTRDTTRKKVYRRNVRSGAFCSLAKQRPGKEPLLPKLKIMGGSAEPNGARGPCLQKEFRGADRKKGTNAMVSEGFTLK